MIGPTISGAGTPTGEAIKTTTTTTIRIDKVGTKETSTAGLMEDAITQAMIARQRCRDTRMMQHFRTKWVAANEGAADG
eukprot:5739030-Ditylum_brightwellii.AAC.1